MSRHEPRPGCFDLAFTAAWPIDEPGEVALEDYAREMTSASAAEAVRAPDDPSTVAGVHVCDLSVAITPALLADVEDFVRSLLGRPPGPATGWR